MKEKKKKAPSRRSDVVRCPKCGEDYSITYKRCPFCEERPGRLGVAGSGGSHPIQLLMTILSFAVIITALFIVFRYVSPLILGHQTPGGSSSAGTSQSGDVSGATSGDTSSDSSADSSLGDPSVPVNALSLSRSDVTLGANERYTFKVTVDPENAKVTWSSSDDSILTVDEKGTITNVNSGEKKVKVTVTATAGDKSAACTVYCSGNSTKPATPPDDNPSGGNTTTPDNNNPSGGNTTTPDNNSTGGNTTAPTAINKRGYITNAGDGLNIRSGPGTTHEVVASAANDAEIRVLEDAGNGWYKIDYGNGRVGYVSKDYVTIR